MEQLDERKLKAAEEATIAIQETLVEVIPQVVSAMAEMLPSVVESLILFLPQFCEKLKNGDYNELILDKVLEEFENDI